MSDPAIKEKSKTDWERIDAMTDEELDYSDNPPLDEDFFSEAITWRGNKQQITLRLDQDVLDFYRKQGKGYQTMINSVLRKYMEAQKKRKTAR